MAFTNPILLAQLVQEIVNRVMAGGDAEDCLVELKSEFTPNHARTARQIAGMANAAGGQNCLLIVGLDEKGQIVEPNESSSDIATWWDQVKSHFEVRHWPVFRDQFLPVLLLNAESKKIYVAEFVTEQAPYVILHKDKGNVSKEFPWREGTQVRSAGRFEFVRLLAPQIAKPYTQVTKASVGRGKNCGSLKILFVVSPGSKMLIPTSGVSATVWFDETPFECKKISLKNASPLFKDSSSEFVELESARELIIEAYFPHQDPLSSRFGKVWAEVEMLVPNLGLGIKFESIEFVYESNRWQFSGTPASELGPAPLDLNVSWG